MNYIPESEEDFIGDAHFRRWVKSPDAASTAYWESFLENHPEKRETVQRAAEVVRRLSDASAALMEAQYAGSEKEDEIWQGIAGRITPEEAPVRRFFGRRVAAAAGIVLVAGLGIGLFRYLSSETTVPALAPVALENRVDSVTVFNEQKAPRLVSLPDGSSVILKKGSHLRYASPFEPKQRIVALSGEAYFEVVRDPGRPFLVHANGLVAKVLGTSFDVRAWGANADVTVTVRTGKVAVFQEPEEEETRPKERFPQQVILTPNEQVVFARKALKLFKSPVNALAEAKLPVIRPVSLVYDSVPVSTVFREIEKVYGIKVVIEQKALENCRITTDLKDGTLSQKLDIICKTIEANWSTKDAFVAVSGRGCAPLP